MKKCACKMRQGFRGKPMFLGIALLLLCPWLSSAALNGGQAKDQASTPNPAGGEAKKNNPEGEKAPTQTQQPDPKKNTGTPDSDKDKKNSSQPLLTLVGAEDQTIWELVEGHTASFTLQVTTDSASGVNLAQIKFVPADAKTAPAESMLVRVVGPASGYPRPLKDGDKMQFTLVFPPHRPTGTYKAKLTYATAEAPDQPIEFHAATVRVGMLWKWTAALVAGFFCFVIILLTFLVSKLGNKLLNFFQSPDGGYSVSKFQIWIWTLVIVFSYSYLFLWQGGDLDIPVSTWALLGISVASTGIAKVIAVKQEENKGGSVAPAAPPQPAPNSPNAPTTGQQAAAAGVGKVLTVAPRPNWLTSMLSDGGQLSLMRIQMFAWTMVTAIIYLVNLFQQQELWDVPAGLLVLMGISHGGYLVDKGATPSSDMKCESIQPNSIKSDPLTKKNLATSIVILGQNFKPDQVKCFLGGIALTPTTLLANRIEAPLPAGVLDGGNKYDLVVQQPGENSEVLASAFEVTL